MLLHRRDEDDVAVALEHLGVRVVEAVGLLWKCFFFEWEEGERRERKTKKGEFFVLSGLFLERMRGKEKRSSFLF